MDKQLIISLGREYGSGGRIIAEQLAEHYGIPLYDYNLVNEIAKEKNVIGVDYSKYDEVPKKRLISRNVKGHINSPEEHIANMQFDFLRRKADEGQSFVVVGRCSESVLAGRPGLITIFILGDEEAKVKRIAMRDGLTMEEASKKVLVQNRMRKFYHNYYCEGKWGDSRNYDISVNSTRLGMEGTVKMLIDYIDQRRQQEDQKA
ncbi:MAG: AAA family ATPase [Lachnospiraceae bacterium]